MARKKKNDSGGAIPVIVIVVLIILALATPIVIFIGFLYNSMKVSEIRKKLSGNKSDFWLDNQENLDFKEKIAHLVKVNEIIEQAKHKGIDAGISRNQDGSFSARSNLGKEIRAAFEKYGPIKNALSADLYELQMLPIYRWGEFNKYVKNAKSFIWAFYSWVGALLYYAITLGKESISDTLMPYLALATNFFRDEGKMIQMVDGDVQMIAVATIVAIISYFLFGLIVKNSGQKYTPVPDKVTLENVDSYWGSMHKTPKSFINNGIPES